MKLFFDHRNFTGLYANFLVDGISFGYCYLGENKITAIDFPDNARTLEIYFSYKKVEGCKKLKKEEHESKSFPNRKGKLSLKYYKKVEDNWKFPYYYIIDMEKSEEDICFFPAIFSETELQGALYYQTCLYSGNAFSNAILKKDRALEKEIKMVRRKRITKNFIGCIVSLIMALLSAGLILLQDLPSYEVRGIIGFLIIGVVFTPICFTNTWACLKYRGMINYSKITDEIVTVKGYNHE